MDNNTVDINDLSEIQAILLLLLDSDNSKPVKGKTHLQKEMFLIIDKLNNERLNKLAQYEAYHYGPYSEVVDFELERLQIMNLANVEGTRIVITKLGKKYAEKLKEYISQDVLNRIKSIKEQLNDLSHYELLALVYFNYPNMTSESDVLDEILKNRKKLAKSLLKKGKIDESQAALIANADFENLKSNMIESELFNELIDENWKNICYEMGNQVVKYLNANYPNLSYTIVYDIDFDSEEPRIIIQVNNKIPPENEITLLKRVWNEVRKKYSKYMKKFHVLLDHNYEG